MTDAPPGVGACERLRTTAVIEIAQVELAHSTRALAAAFSGAVDLAFEDSNWWAKGESYDLGRGLGLQAESE